MTEKPPCKAFRAGISLSGLMKAFLGETAAREWFESIYWREERTCGDGAGLRMRVTLFCKPARFLPPSLFGLDSLMRTFVPASAVFAVSSLATAQGDQATITNSDQVTTTTVTVTGPATVSVSVEEAPDDREVHFSVGYDISDLTEPRYGVDSMRRLVEDTESAGKFSTGVVKLMMHMNLADDGWCQLSGGDSCVLRDLWGSAISFGVGDSDDGNRKYMLGWSWHVAHQAYITFGRNWTRVPTVKVGHELGEVVPLGSSLPLDKKVEDGWFVSVSYVISGPDEGLLKWGAGDE